MNASERFPRRVEALSDVADPFRHALLRQLAENDEIRLIVYGPASNLLSSHAPATILIVTNKGFIVVAESANNSITMVRSDFMSLLFLELSIILLSGCLTMHVAAKGGTQRSSIHFNSVMAGLYEEAVQLLLDGVDGIHVVFSPQDNIIVPSIGELPLKFRNALREFRPTSQHVLSVLHRRAIIEDRHRWFSRELAPEAVLALTDREVILISEERSLSWISPGQTVKYGTIVTYFPLARVENVELTVSDKTSILSFDIGRERDVKKPQILFSRDQNQDVRVFVQHTLDHQSGLRRGYDAS